MPKAFLLKGVTRKKKRLINIKDGLELVNNKFWLWMPLKKKHKKHLLRGRFSTLNKVEILGLHLYAYYIAYLYFEEKNEFLSSKKKREIVEQNK